MYPDFLTCGQCGCEYPLFKITEFIEHKTSCVDPQTPPTRHSLCVDQSVECEPWLSCTICRQDLHSAWGAIQHARHKHGVDLVQEKTHHSLTVSPSQQTSSSAFSSPPLNLSSAGNNNRSSGASVFSIGVNGSQTASDTLFTSNVPSSSSQLADGVSSCTATCSSATTPMTCTRLAPTEEATITCVSSETTPVTCAQKLASTSEGTTICCSGKECKVTINPMLPYKKRCRSGGGGPHKRRSSSSSSLIQQQQQEMDTELMERCAFETLATLRGRLLMRQQSSSSSSSSCSQGRKRKGKTSSSKQACRRESQCAGGHGGGGGASCDDRVCEMTACEDDCNGELTEEGERCRSCGDGVEAEPSETHCCSPAPCTSTGSGSCSSTKRSQVEIYSGSSKKTVIMDPGVTVTVQQTSPHSSSADPSETQKMSNPSTSAAAPVSSEDASQESAQILAELMHSHSSLNLDQMMQSMPSGGVSDSSLADDTLHSLFASSNFQDSGGGALSRCPMFSNTGMAESVDLAGGDMTCPVMQPPSPPPPLPPPPPPPSSVQESAAAVSHNMDGQQTDLDSLTPSIQAVPCLEHISQKGSVMLSPQAIPGPSLETTSLQAPPGLSMVSGIGSSLGSALGNVLQGNVLQGNVPVKVGSVQGNVLQSNVPVKMDSAQGNVPGSSWSAPMKGTVPVASGISVSCDESSEGERMSTVMKAGVKKRRYPTSRPYKCSQCDQAFNQPIHLKKHMSKHTGVKPFKCDDCGYSTVERSHLRAHNRIHTGEKPFQCQFCSYASAQNSTLKAHLKRNHRDQLTHSATTSNAVASTSAERQ